MTENTKIEWAHHTFNPWMGCTKVSPACEHCYAETLMDKRLNIVQWGVGMPRKRSSPANWKRVLRWNAKAAKQGIRQRVFCASLADVFDNEVPTAWRADLFALIDETPNLDWLLLTKRIGNVVSMMRVINGDIQNTSLPSNVWLGISICNQEEADRDIPKLLAIPAELKFLSIEPLLGPIDLMKIEYLTAKLGSYPFKYFPDKYRSKLLHMIDWVIVGGESGRDARPMHPDWVTILRDQCKEASVPFFFKQWGEWHTRYITCSNNQPTFKQFMTHQDWVNKASSWVNGGICLDTDGKLLRNGRDMANARDSNKFPVTIMHRVGKKAAGRLLDGVIHNAFPLESGYES